MSKTEIKTLCKNQNSCFRLRTAKKTGRFFPCPSISLSLSEINAQENKSSCFLPDICNRHAGISGSPNLGLLSRKQEFWFLSKVLVSVSLNPYLQCPSFHPSATRIWLSAILLCITTRPRLHQTLCNILHIIHWWQIQWQIPLCHHCPLIYPWPLLLENLCFSKFLQIFTLNLDQFCSSLSETIFTFKMSTNKWLKSHLQNSCNISLFIKNLPWMNLCYPR